MLNVRNIFRFIPLKLPVSYRWTVPLTCILICFLHVFFTFTGKLQNNSKAVIKNRKILVKNKIMFPVYVIEDLNTGKVNIIMYSAHA
jgi:hypothetical protein